jgi:hypothetical protein
MLADQGALITVRRNPWRTEHRAQFPVAVIEDVQWSYETSFTCGVFDGRVAFFLRGKIPVGALSDDQRTSRAWGKGVRFYLKVFIVSRDNRGNAAHQELKALADARDAKGE